MSLLADLLSRIKQPQAKRDIPPNLKNIVQSSSNKSSAKRKIVVLSIILVVFVLAGIAALFFVKQLEQSSGSSITITEQDHTPEPVAPEAVKVEKPAVKAVQTGQTQKTDSISVSQGRVTPTEKIEKEADTNTASSVPSVQEKLSKQRDLHLYSAREYELKSAYSQALAEYKKALEADSNNFSIMTSIAFVYLKLGNNYASISHSEKALEINSEYVPALTNMGIALAKQEQLKEAENYFLSALALEPENRNVLLNFAILLEKQGKNESSADYYKRLIGLGNIEGMFGLARIYERQGEIDKAMQVYKNASSHESIDEQTKTRIRQKIIRLTNN
jgi:Tfp pilus assembly protein PilF